MEQQLKILYKDESGNLRLHKGIGICDIYVFNDSLYQNPVFWIISRNKVVVEYFHLKNEDDIVNLDLQYPTTYDLNNKSRRFIHLRDQDQKIIYDYIKNNYDNNGILKIDNMINSYYNYFNKSNDNNTIVDNGCLYINENHEKILDFGDRLGKCKIMVNDQFGIHPMITIHSPSAHFYGFISMLTGKYFGGDMLIENEYKVLDNYMRIRPNFHSQSHGPDFFDKSSNWYFILNDYLTFDGYIDNTLIKKCINYTDTDNQIPKFNSEEYSINMNLNDYINKLVKGEVIL